MAGGDETLAATITVQHLMLDRNAMLVGGIRPHYYCLPILKRETHREVLVRAAMSGDRRYFLGTDSAPHADPIKENACGCAGCFTAPVAMACLAQLFDDHGKLHLLERFTSEHGARFYGLPLNTGTLTLEKGEPIDIPDAIETGAGPVTVFNPGRPIHWRVKE